MPARPVTPRIIPDLTFVAAVALRLDGAISVGETPDGVRMQFMVRGTVEGPKMKGDFSPGTLAFLRIDRDGVGTRSTSELRSSSKTAARRSSRRAGGTTLVRKDIAKPSRAGTPAGVGPRLVSAPRHVGREVSLAQSHAVSRRWKAGSARNARRLRPLLHNLDHRNRNPRKRRSLPSAPRPPFMNGSVGARGIYRLMSASIDSLHANEQLNRQNPKLAMANAKLSLSDLKEKVTDFICKLSGGPCLYGTLDEGQSLSPRRHRR